MFTNREAAGRLLADRLRSYQDDPSGLIVALPRGGVPVGYAVSLALHLPLDVFITRKIGAPGNPEFAIGAVAETGSVFLNPGARRVLKELFAPPGYLDEAVAAQRAEIARRQALYRRGRLLPPLGDRTVLLVDDGVATGATFLASVEALKAAGVKRLVAAIPVGPADTLHTIGRLVDELVVLHIPESFFAVGEHYLEFAQVEDDQVIRYLKQSASALQRQSRTGQA